MTETINTLVSFDGSDGANPRASFISDAAGDLFGTTSSGGANDDGTVFELVKTGSTYGAPITLASFNGSNGNDPTAALISDAAGDLFGTTGKGGADNDGTVFEIAKTGSAYAAPLTLATFTGSGNGALPFGALISDASGDLFGTTDQGGASGNGTLFEIVKTGSTYGAPVTLATFNGTGNGAFPEGSLITDAQGDLFGTTSQGGPKGFGTLFLIAKKGSTYSAPLTFVTFNGTGNGGSPEANLISDAAGDLFGTTSDGGASNDGTVFEITTAGSTVTLAFTGANGSTPEAGLITDEAGDLFGTTTEGGSSNDGTVFEVIKTGSGYAAPLTLESFFGGDGAEPVSALFLDAAGDLFGTTLGGGTNSDGTVFEITGTTFFNLEITSTGGSIYQTSQTISGTIDVNDASRPVSIYDGSTLIGTATPSGSGAWSATVNLLSTPGAQTITAQATDTAGAVGTSSAVTYTLLHAVAGDLNADSTSDVLLQNGGTVVDWLMQNGLYSTGNVITTAATGYTVVGTGDFDGDRVSDALLQNGGTVVDWIMQNGQYHSGNVITTAATGFTVVGTGDFNGDGTSDALLQNGGTVVDWIMQNGQYHSGNTVTTGATGYTVVGSGDFDGDGTSDVLLQNGGTVIDWIMKNGQYQSGNVLTTGATGFTVVGTGDYNGDGTSDVLLQNGGTVVDWIMKNGAYQSGNIVTTGATGFTVSP